MIVSWVCPIEGCEKMLRSYGDKYCNSHRMIVKKGGQINRKCRICQDDFVYIDRETNGMGNCLSCNKIQKIFNDKRHLYNNHSINSLKWMEIFKSQNGRCKLCSYKPDFKMEKFQKIPLHLDHDHNCCDTSKFNRYSCGNCIRGLLCYSCNLMIGHYESCKGDLSIYEFDKYLSQPRFIFTN